MSILRKNPNSFRGIQLRELKNGVAIGRVVGPTQYDMVFQDTKYSFSDDMTNQIDFQSYCNPRVFLSMVSIFLRHMITEQDKYESAEISWLDTTVGELDSSDHTHTMMIDNVYADGFSPERGFVLNKYFPEVKLEYKHGRLFGLTIETNQSVFHLMNLASLVMVYIAANNRQKWWLSKDMVAKYIRILKNLRPVPYFVLYLFARNCIRGENDFEFFKADLESCSDQDPEMTWGNTQQMRIREVGDRLLVDGEIPHNVIEVGCGEMDYPRHYLKKMGEDTVWWSHDLTDYSHIAPKIRERTGVREFWFTQDIDAIPKYDSSVLLMVEMIEHMPLKEAKSYVRDLLVKFRPTKVIMTTPNRNFNRHFEIDRFRHDDHHFEFTPEEFAMFIVDVMYELPSDHGYNRVTAFGIGDKVGGDYLTLGMELERV
jgi:hypothetical protein